VKLVAVFCKERHLGHLKLINRFSSPRMQLARFKKIGVKGNLYIIFVLLSFTSKVK
jgi:hypothetical protein